MSTALLTCRGSEPWAQSTAATVLHSLTGDPKAYCISPQLFRGERVDVTRSRRSVMLRWTFPHDFAIAAAGPTHSAAAGATSLDVLGQPLSPCP